MKLKKYFADMHIHIGRDHNGKAVKITGAKSLTLTNILIEASQNKGMDMVGVIDCHVPAVQAEIRGLLNEGLAEELIDGGIRFETVTLIMGSEIEVYDENCKGPIHVLCFFPTLAAIGSFTQWLKNKMSNINLSSQRYYGSVKALQYKVKELSGIFIPAHIFTPFKSLYGKGVERSLEEVLDASLIDGVELGLSSDTFMVNGIDELSGYTFLTNSDAHSLGKIGREYQEIRMEESTFKEFLWAIHQVDGRGINRNFGMNPRLGKYYHTVCKDCLNEASKTQPCAYCGSLKRINGVKDRIQELSGGHILPKRPPYIHQIPLEYIPTLGPKTYRKLLDIFGTEMDIIHQVESKELKKVVPQKLVDAIIDNREGRLVISPGGGGKYGKVVSNRKELK
ncbi:endonuclease Q family protein [Oceanobacillus luteolus]|uniref:Endonuclease Q family protein n=1 Tax=Oceanobacillus luteolus TaxID=1274358 RepID=A0ABW4HWS1_9BACI|nr:endonuclease Q family protein [Oceanobacillus luteolus]MCM3738802.1 endonuclease Q family protein [Oceanobacillus luteolus]